MVTLAEDRLGGNKIDDKEEEETVQINIEEEEMELLLLFRIKSNPRLKPGMMLQQSG